MEGTKTVFDVISPDGFSINMEGVYSTPEAAQAAIPKFVERYRSQGYYSSMKGRISLEDLPAHCTVVPLEFEEDEEIEFLDLQDETKI